jgi:alanyl-tRNA synthetase
MTASEILSKYLTFFETRGHKRIANAPLVPINDPTTLFTSSGMQALIPYLLGQEHPQGDRLVNVQNCIRSQDIEEVGDNRHTTFFRMIGNWSLGSYFKAEQLPWFWELLTEELNLNPKRIYVSAFIGDEANNIPKDTESATIWKRLFQEKGIAAKEVELGSAANGSRKGMQDGRIFFYDAKENWWSRAGGPDKMPAGEPGGPDSEVFYEFPDYHHTPEYGEYCHPACDCGRFIEIGNSVFMQYVKNDKGGFDELPQRNVDYGGGLERIAAAVNDDPDVFRTDLYFPILNEVEQISGKTYGQDENTIAMRVIADHMKAAVYLAKQGVIPANKEQGYVLRRLIRRSAVKMRALKGTIADAGAFDSIIASVITVEAQVDDSWDTQADFMTVARVIRDELERFNKTLEKGLRVLEKADAITEQTAFDLYQSYGFPYEITEEILASRGKSLNRELYEAELQKHQESSRTASAGMFRGGLADHSEKTIMGHTATHLLHQALRDVLGIHVHQTGSNITSERIRFDFNYDKRLTDAEIEQVQHIVNEKIKENLPVRFELIETKQAHDMGAIGLFMDTYGEKSKIYFIGPQAGSMDKPYSIEFCGGPHVDFTGALKSITIIKQENLGKNQKRLYAKVGTE